MKDSMKGWLNDQYKTNLPAAVLKSPKSYGGFLQGVESALDQFIMYIKTRSCVPPDREDVIRKLCGILLIASWYTNEKTTSLMFIAHQIVADLEELVSKDGCRGESPFPGVFVWPGYGGKEGFTAMDHKQILGRECLGPGYKDWSTTKSPAYFVEVCQNLKQEMENELPESMLAMLGVEKVGGIIKVCLNGRHISLSDFEHLMCKVYMGCMRSRGTRNGGSPKPWRDYCWPSKKEDTVGDQVIEGVIITTIVGAYEQALTSLNSVEAGGNPGLWVLPALDHPFCDI
jgi:hypothetical protein